MVAVLLVDVGLAIYILPKDPAMDLFIYSDGVQVDFTIGDYYTGMMKMEIRRDTYLNDRHRRGLLGGNYACQPWHAACYADLVIYRI